jgi:hypothetical protein
MDAILQSILDVTGVSAAMVFDGSGHLIGHRGRAVYDQALCEQVGGLVAKAVDTIQLQQEDWDSIAAQYGDGKLLMHKLACTSGPYTLAIVADATLNASFATVAIRVAANKLRKLLDGVASQTPAPRPAVPATGATPSPSDSKPVLSSSGLSWSKASSSGLSRISVADPASMAFLSLCSKELARHVGPMAKVYLEEAVRRVSPDTPFSLSAATMLCDDLAGQIEDAKDREQFRKAVAKG